MRNKVKYLFVAISCVIVFSKCNNTEEGKGIETDDDLGKPLSELVLKYPDLIKRNSNIPIDKFTFNNKCFENYKKERLTMHSIDLRRDNEHVVVTFPNKDMELVNTSKKGFSNVDINIILKDNRIIIEDDYTKKIIFKGLECK